SRVQSGRKGGMSCLLLPKPLHETTLCYSTPSSLQLVAYYPHERKRLKLYNGGISTSESSSPAPQGQDAVGREQSPRGAGYSGTKTITHFPVPAEVKAAARRDATTRTIVSMAVPQPSRQTESRPPDSAQVFDLYLATPVRPAAALGSEPIASRETTPVPVASNEIAPSERQRATPAVALADLLDSGMRPVWPQGLHLLGRVLECLQQTRHASGEPGRNRESAAHGAHDAHDTKDAPALPDASRIEVDITGAVRVAGAVADGPDAVQVVSSWLYRVAVGRYPTPNERQLPTRANRALPRWVDTVCVRGLTNDVANRYPNLAALAQDLREHAPPPSQLDVASWVLHVLRGQQPTEIELAGELGHALVQFTYASAEPR